MKKLIIITGESGSGKDSIQKMLGINPVVSHSTRPIRSGEQNGVQYHFVTKEEFDKIEMVETREYHTLFNGKPDTWYYGVSVDEINSKVNATHNTPCVILDIKGMTFMKHWCNANGIETITFYIKVDKFIRTLRAIKRGSFSLKEWMRRLQDDKIEFHWAESWCDYTVKNYNLSKCVDEILKIVFWRGENE